MLLYAGADSVGGTLAWLMYELGIHDDVQQNLRDEIVAVMKGVYMHHALPRTACTVLCELL
jgi:cytochrome P450